MIYSKDSSSLDPSISYCQCYSKNLAQRARNVLSGSGAGSVTFGDRYLGFVRGDVQEARGGARGNLDS